MSKLLLAIGAGCLICLAGYVMAQTATLAPDESSTVQQEDRDTRLRLAAMDTSVAAFRKLDQDNDGRISALEAAENPRVAAAFTMADRDKDGYLSKEEFESMRSAATPPR